MKGKAKMKMAVRKAAAKKIPPRAMKGDMDNKGRGKMMKRLEGREL